VKPKVETSCKVAAILALLGLGMVVWSLVSPRPVPVLLATTLGQLLGGASLVLFAVAVLADLKVGRALQTTDQERRSPG
jgi:hypothetical protein